MSIVVIVQRQLEEMSDLDKSRFSIFSFLLVIRPMKIWAINDDNGDVDMLYVSGLLFPQISPATAPINFLPIKTISSTAGIYYGKIQISIQIDNAIHESLFTSQKSEERHRVRAFFLLFCKRDCQWLAVSVRRTIEIDRQSHANYLEVAESLLHMPRRHFWFKWHQIQIKTVQFV